MTMAENFTQEHQLSNKLDSEIANFWQTGVFSSFQGIDDKRINYAAFNINNKAQCLVISPGRSEGYLKYQELIFDLSKQQYNIFVIDHRGQGLSERLLPTPQKGYVKNFDDYADDLNYFITEVVQPHCALENKPLLLTHSMGGAIALRMMQKYPNTVKSALLSSPMIAINKGGIPEWLAKTLINSGDFLNSIVGSEPWYFIGQGGYKATLFKDNALMQSPIRYQKFVKLYQDNTQLQLGGVTINWLKEALKAKSNIFEQLNSLTTPITIMRAGDDTVVDNEAQDNFCKQLHKLNNDQCEQGQVINIAGARHELFFETDEYRNQALSIVTQWLTQNKE